MTRRRFVVLLGTLCVFTLYAQITPVAISSSSVQPSAQTNAVPASSPQVPAAAPVAPAMAPVVAAPQAPAAASPAAVVPQTPVAASSSSVQPSAQTNAVPASSPQVPAAAPVAPAMAPVVAAPQAPAAASSAAVVPQTPVAASSSSMPPNTQTSAVPAVSPQVPAAASVTTPPPPSTPILVPQAPAVVAPVMVPSQVPALPQAPVSSALAPIYLVPPMVDSTCLVPQRAAGLYSLLATQLQAAGFSMTGTPQLEVRLLVGRREGPCEFVLSTQAAGFGAATFSTEMRKGFDPMDTSAMARLSQGGAQELARRYMQASFGGLLVACSEPQVQLQVGNQQMACPAQVDHLAPGRYPVNASAPGWNPRVDTVTVMAGQVAQLQVKLQRSQAWLDSVAHAQRIARHDSIIQVAQANPLQALPDMFARLFSIQLPAGIQPVAVLPFAVSGEKSQDYDPGVMAAEYAVNALSKDPRFQVVERANLDKVLAEQALVQAGAVSDSAAAESGKLAAARWTVIGSVTVGATSQIFFARLVNVETGEVVSAASAQVGESSLRGLYLDAIGERTHASSSIFRSLVAPGWGQFYANHPVHGAVSSALALGAIGYTVWRGLDFRDKDETLDDFENKDASTVVEGETQDDWNTRANDAVNARNDAAKQFNIACGVLAGVWVANIIDAWIVGAMDANRVKTQYFTPKVAVAPVIDGNRAGLVLAGRF